MIGAIIAQDYSERGLFITISMHTWHLVEHHGMDPTEAANIVLDKLAPNGTSEREYIEEFVIRLGKEAQAATPTEEPG